MNSKTITLAGAVLLIIGLFLPIFTVMQLMSVTFFSPEGTGPKIDTWIVLACAVIAAALALVNQAKWAVIPGLAALGLIVYNYIALQNQLGSAMSQVSAEQAEMASQMAQVNYLGWGVMCLGCVVILVGGAMGFKSSPPAA